MKTSALCNPLLHWQSLLSNQRVRELFAANQNHLRRADRRLSRISGVPLLLVNATCAAFGGAGRMTLADWRDAEERPKKKVR